MGFICFVLVNHRREPTPVTAAKLPLPPPYPKNAPVKLVANIGERRPPVTPRTPAPRLPPNRGRTGIIGGRSGVSTLIREDMREEGRTDGRTLGLTLTGTFTLILTDGRTLGRTDRRVDGRICDDTRDDTPKMLSLVFVWVLVFK